MWIEGRSRRSMPSDDRHPSTHELSVRAWRDLCASLKLMSPGT
jgi:hypothetical protein